MTKIYKIMNSPVGILTLVTRNQGITAILLEKQNQKGVSLKPLSSEENNQILLETEEQLNNYFDGKLKKFSLKLDFVGTEFQKKVWEALLTIPFGETRSYGDIAKKIGAPKAARAVGAAIGKNPISIIAPCHRVIGVSGKLTGFSGGLEAKAYLLNFESNINLKN